MMLISQSFWRQAVATSIAAIVLVFVWQTTTRDSRYAAREARPVETTGVLQAGAQLQFTATAYCKGETTSSGVVVRTGVAAADPALLPVGTVMRIDMPKSALQRNLDGDGHRPRGAGARCRSLSLELHGGARVWTTAGSPDAAAARLESPA
jgi:hypothetical protein